jgi:hypothetical protein
MRHAIPPSLLILRAFSATPQYIPQLSGKQGIM